MSDFTSRPIPGTGRTYEGRRTEPNWPVHPSEARPRSEAETGPYGPEPDRLELRSTGVESYAVFTVQPRTGVVSIKIIDARTDEVIREIPSEEILHIAEQAQAYLEAARTRWRLVG